MLGRRWGDTRQVLARCWDACRSMAPGEMLGRCRRDTGEMLARCRGDAWDACRSMAPREMLGRCWRDVREMRGDAREMPAMPVGP